MIEIKSLSKRFGENTVLDNFSLSFDGKILGICGAKKSGKTVLLNIICGIVPPSEGEVLIAGEAISNNSALANKTVGYLLERSPMPLEMTPTEFLKFVGEAKSIPSAKLSKQIAAALDITGLEPLKKTYIEHLSVGQRKILGVAQALLGNPKLIVLDDPFLGLNKEEFATMKNIITTLGGIKTVIISASNKMGLADLCSEVITLSEETTDDSTEAISEAIEALTDANNEEEKEDE